MPGAEQVRQQDRDDPEPGAQGDHDEDGKPALHRVKSGGKRPACERFRKPPTCYRTTPATVDPPSRFALRWASPASRFALRWAGPASRFAPRRQAEANRKGWV